MSSMTQMHHLEIINCGILYDLRFLSGMQHLSVFNMSQCFVDQDNMVTGIRALPNLQHLSITKCAFIHAYNIVEAIKNKPTLKTVDVRGTGYMKSVLAGDVLNTCPSIKQFFFSNLYTYDSEFDKLRWIRILTRFRHTEFCDDLVDRVHLYCNSGKTVSAYIDYAEILDNFGP